jgi:hypothetical protein
MNGYSVAFTADLRTRPDVADVRPYLARALDALDAHPDVSSAIYRYDWQTHRITFELSVDRVTVPDLAMRRAVLALRQALESVGVRTAAFGATGVLPPVQVRLQGWPDSIRRT